MTLDLYKNMYANKFTPDEAADALNTVKEVVRLRDRIHSEIGEWCYNYDDHTDQIQHVLKPLRAKADRLDYAVSGFTKNPTLNGLRILKRILIDAE